MDHDEKLTRLADDLEQVKSAIARSATVLREVAGPFHYRWLVGYLGIAVVAFCLLFHFVPRAYGGFAATPAWVRTLLVVGAIAAALAGSVVKLLTVGRLAQSVDRRLTFLSFFRRYYAPMIAHLYPPLILITVGVCAWLVATGRPSAIVGTLGLFGGLMLNLMGANLRQAEYLAFGYWMLSAGAASFFVPALPAVLWVAIVFGAGSLVFSAATMLPGRRR